MRTAALAAIAALALGAGGCAARGGVPSPFPGATAPSGAPEPAAVLATPAAGADGVVATALAQQGVPYRFGGSDPSGFDCSGLVQYAFAQQGVRLPRETVDQYQVGEEVAARELQPGDLVFFETVSRGPSHVGVAIGDNRFVHAPAEGGAVRVERLTVTYWSRRFIGARRVVAGDAVVAAAAPPPPDDRPFLPGAVHR